MKKLHQCCAVVLAAALVLCGCQSVPEQIAPTPEAAGALTQLAVPSTDEPEEAAPKTPSAIHKSFTSTDQSVHYDLNIQPAAAVSTLPTVKVQPHNLTEQDVRQAAYALFGDADFYEREPYASAKFTKSEIQDRLQRWSAYIEDEALSQLYGTEDNTFVQELLQSYIQDYTLKLETATEENVHTPCKWEFQEESRYTFAADTLTPGELANDNSAIMANCTVDGIAYAFDAVTRNKADYKLNMITAYIDSANSPFAIDEAIVRARLCRTAKPGQAQLDAVSQKAERILEELHMGQWMVASCTLREDAIGSQTEYTVQVNALPVFEGAAAIDCEPFFKLKGEEVYASNYYLTGARFTFAPDGTLLSFELTSPVDILEVGEETQVAGTAEEMVARGMNQLSLTDCYAFYTGDAGNLSGFSPVCNVSITGGTYGLIRTRVANQADQYQYTPAFVFTGTYEISNPDTGELFQWNSEPGILLALNVTNGAVLIAPGA